MASIHFMRAATLFVALILTVAENAFGASASLVPRDLIQKAQRDQVRVIVRLAADNVGGSPFDSDIMRGLRRTRIAKAQNSLRATLLGARHRVRHQFRDFPFMALEVGTDGLRTLDSLNGLVTEVMEDKVYQPLLAQSVPLVQANQVWAGAFGGTPYDGSGTVVAILDTGVDKNHPFLGNVVEEACFSSNDNGLSATSLCPGGAESSFASGSGMSCDPAVASCNHGTHVAGIVAGSGASFSGVARGADIMSVQVFSKFDNPALCNPMPSPCVLSYVSDQMAGLQRVYDRRDAYNFAAVNMSLGGGASSTACDGDPMKAIIDLLRGANIATVIAAGNNAFTDALSFPACISSAVSVGSSGDGSGGATADSVSWFSNSAPFLSLLAPGAVITSSVPGSGFSNFQGTSMATPHVSGAFAILKQAGPGLTVGQMLSALQNTGLPVLDTRNSITKPRIRILEALFDLPLGDVTAPGKVADLKAGSATQTTVNLTWTAPGDDGTTGTASRYYVRFSTSKMSESNWSAALEANGPAPLNAGMAQSFTVSGLLCNKTYYFAIKTSDEINNTSAISNIARGKTAACNKLKVKPTTLPAGEVNVAYNSGILEVTGGVAPYDMRIDPAALPPGLAYGSQSFSGVPTQAKTFSIGAVVTDNVGSEVKVRLRLMIARAVTITTTQLKAGRVNANYSAALKAKDGVKAYTWSLVPTGALPGNLAVEANTGRITGWMDAPDTVDFVVQVMDGAGGTDSQPLTITFN